MITLDESILSFPGPNPIPSLDDLTALSQRCRKQRNLTHARHIHAHICSHGLETHKDIGNYLVPMFVECGNPTMAEQVFHKIIHLNEFSWTSLMEGYVRFGNAQNALDLYEELKVGLLPSRYTFNVLLKACTKLKCLEKGRIMHFEVMKEELESDRFIASSLMGMYAKCGSLVEAHNVFEELPAQDVVSWTTLIAGYVDHGFPAEALECLEKMRSEGVHPDRVTYIYGLKACGLLRSLEKGKDLHAEVDRKGFNDASISNALQDMYVKCGSLSIAQEIFDKLPNRDVSAWNLLMAGYVEENLYEEAISSFSRMMLEGVSPDATSFVCILKACARLKAIEKGREIHKEIDKRKLGGDPYIGSILVDMYAKCGFLEEAQEAFDSLAMKEVVSWTSLIAGYAENNLHEKALECLRQMQVEGMVPDSITFMCCLKSCGAIVAIDKGQEIHASIVEDGYEGDNRLGSALVDMYIRLSLLEEAQDVFDELEDQDVVSWTSLITAYSEHGLGEAALNCFQRMQENNVHPDAITFACILKICSITDSIEQGQTLHAQIIKNGFEKDPFIANCLMDMYLKCCFLHEAEEIFDQLPVKDVISWTALIGGYAEHGFAEKAWNSFVQMQSKGIYPNAVTYVCILKTCGSIKATEKGQLIHNYIIKDGFEDDLFIGSNLVGMYAKCGLLLEAEGTLNDLAIRDLPSWSALISGYLDQGFADKALSSSKEMQEEMLHLDATTYVCSLKACGAVRAIDHGYFLHDEIVKRGYEQDHFISSVLIDMYAKCSLLLDAKSVFDKLLVRDIVSWSSITTGYVDSGQSEEALKCLQHMEEDGAQTNVSMYVCILKLYGIIGDLQKGQLLHSDIIGRGDEINQQVATALIGMYANCGSLVEARKIFNKVTEPDLVMWNTLIRGYAEQGLYKDTLDCLQEMKVSCDSVTYIFSLKACKNIGEVSYGQKIHANVIEEGYEHDIIIGSSLLDMYASRGYISDAKEVFEELPIQDVITWTALIRGYSELGLGDEVIDCYTQMQLDGISPDAVTMAYIIQSCGNLGVLQKVQEMHAEVTKKGYEQDSCVGNDLVQTYGKCCSLSEARAVFDNLSNRDVVSWTALMTGYADKGLWEEVFHFFECMQLERISPDVISFLCNLRATYQAGNLDKTRELHDKIIKKGFETDSSIGNSLVGLYARCNLFAEALDTFGRLEVQDVVSWTALIAGYSEQGHFEEAFSCFQEMQLGGLLPDVVLWSIIMTGCAEQGKSDEISILLTKMQDQGLSPSSAIYLAIMKAYSNAAALDSLRKVHAQIPKVALENEFILRVSLIEMYGKCGSMIEAQQAFCASPSRDPMTWNALLTGLSRHGESTITFSMLNRMIEEGIQPDDTSFVTLLTTCSHVGLLDMGQKYFESMSKEFGIMPTIKHYNCLVDLFGRAGRMDEAIMTIDRMPFQADFVVWSTVLGACHKYGERELGRQAFKHALRLDGNHAAMFILMSNIYADVDEQEEDEGFECSIKESALSMG